MPKTKNNSPKFTAKLITNFIHTSTKYQKYFSLDK
jgi:hypothetical protein